MVGGRVWSYQIGFCSSQRICRCLHVRQPLRLLLCARRRRMECWECSELMVRVWVVCVRA